MAKVKRASPGRNGQAAVETALALTLLILVGIGAIDFGQAYSRKTGIADAAHRGLRYAIVHPTSWSASDPAASSSIEYQIQSVANIGTVHNQLISGSNSGININYYVVDSSKQPTSPYLYQCGYYNPGSGGSWVPVNGYAESACATSGNVVQITVQGNAKVLTPVLLPFVSGGTFTFSLSATGVIP